MTWTYGIQLVPQVEFIQASISMVPDVILWSNTLKDFP